MLGYVSLHCHLVAWKNSVQKVAIQILVSLLYSAYVFDRSSAGSANMILPIQIMKMVSATTALDVLTFSGHTIALYLK